MPWGAWETFPEYLDLFDGRHDALAVAAQVAHGSLRFHVRRERGVLDFAVAANAQGAHLYPQIAYDFLVDGDGQGIVNLADAGYVHGNLDAVHDMITHPVTVIGLADAGAHVRLICDGSSPSTQLTH